MKPTAISDAEFEREVLCPDGLVIVYFWASWSRPCRIMAPILEMLGESSNGELKIGTLNADKYPELTKEFGVLRIPTILFFAVGKIVDRLEGIASLKYLEMLIQRLTPVAPESCCID